MKISAIKDAILAAMATVGSVIANSLGGWDTALQVLVGVMVADYITGVMVALIWHKSDKTESGRLSSEAGFRGLAKKVGIIAFVWVSTLLDKAIGGEYVRTTVILFYIANEGLSVIENTAAMGIRYPKFVERALEALRAKADTGEIEKQDTESVEREDDENEL